MADTAQAFIIAVVAVLTIILSVIGVQIIFILKEVRRIFVKANATVEGAESVVVNINDNLTEMKNKLIATSALGGVVTLIKSVNSLAQSINKKRQTGRGQTKTKV